MLESTPRWGAGADAQDGMRTRCRKAPEESRRELRCNAILDAAEALFSERGFERTPLSAVVARSGGSLSTLYDEFGNKQNLLLAVVNRVREQAFSDFQEEDLICETPGALLIRFALRFHAYAMSARTVSMMRVVIAHSLNDPEFGRTFHDDMFNRVTARLAARFRQWACEGKADFQDPDLSVDVYLHSFLAHAPVATLMGMPAESTDPDTIIARLQPFLAYHRIAQ